MIREANSPADIDFIARYFEETIALWENYKVTEESIAERRRSVGEWIKQPHTHLTVALAPDGQIVGFNSLWISEGYGGEKFGKICILFVLPEFRRKGVAHQLKLEGEEWLKSKGIKKVVTEIDARNKRMLKISQEAGFKIKGYTMEKRL